MSRKQWSLITLALIGLALSFVIACVAIIDPFQIYHKATAFIPPIDNGYQIYANAGIAKSYDYDSVVIGSSMTENFTPSQLENCFGGTFVKLPINAGTPFNHKQMLDMAFANQDLQRVVYGVDIELMTYFYTTPKCEMPDYLYDDNLFNDVKYWFNTSVLTKYIPMCLKTLGQSDPTLTDTMYNWGDLYAYGKEAALRGESFTCGVIPQETPDAAPQLDQAFRLNVEHNLIPFIESHPETEFLFFYPPYAVTRWYYFYRGGMLETYLNQRAAVADALIGYDNVKFFDFAAETDWICCLDHYIDDGHYGPWINDAMGEAMADGEYRITDAAQVFEHNAVIRSLVDTVVQEGRWPDVFPAAQ